MLERIAAVDAEVDALLAEPGGGSTAERLAVTAAWEALLRRLPAVTHRLVAALAQVPVEELGEPTLAAALARCCGSPRTRRIGVSTRLRILVRARR